MPPEDQKKSPDALKAQSTRERLADLQKQLAGRSPDSLTASERKQLRDLKAEVERGAHMADEEADGGQPVRRRRRRDPEGDEEGGEPEEPTGRRRREAPPEEDDEESDVEESDEDEAEPAADAGVKKEPPAERPPLVQGHDDTPPPAKKAAYAPTLPVAIEGGVRAPVAYLTTRNRRGAGLTPAMGTLRTEMYMQQASLDLLNVLGAGGTDAFIDGIRKLPKDAPVVQIVEKAFEQQAAINPQGAIRLLQEVFAQSEKVITKKIVATIKENISKSDKEPNLKALWELQLEQIGLGAGPYSTDVILELLKKIGAIKLNELSGPEQEMLTLQKTYYEMYVRRTVAEQLVETQISILGSSLEDVKDLKKFQESPRTKDQMAADLVYDWRFPDKDEEVFYASRHVLEMLNVLIKYDYPKNIAANPNPISYYLDKIASGELPKTLAADPGVEHQLSLHDYQGNQFQLSKFYNKTEGTIRLNEVYDTMFASAAEEVRLYKEYAKGDENVDGNAAFLSDKGGIEQYFNTLGMSGNIADVNLDEKTQELFMSKLNGLIDAKHYDEARELCMQVIEEKLNEKKEELNPDYFDNVKYTERTTGNTTEKITKKSKWDKDIGIQRTKLVKDGWEDRLKAQVQLGLAEQLGIDPTTMEDDHDISQLGIKDENGKLIKEADEYQKAIAKMQLTKMATMNAYEQRVRDFESRDITIKWDSPFQKKIYDKFVDVGGLKASSIRDETADFAWDITKSIGELLIISAATGFVGGVFAGAAGVARVGATAARVGRTGSSFAARAVSNWGVRAGSRLRGAGGGWIDSSAGRLVRLANRSYTADKDAGALRKLGGGLANRAAGAVRLSGESLLFMAGQSAMRGELPEGGWPGAFEFVTTFANLGAGKLAHGLTGKFFKKWNYEKSVASLMKASARGVFDYTGQVAASMAVMAYQNTVAASSLFGAMNRVQLQAMGQTAGKDKHIVSGVEYLINADSKEWIHTAAVTAALFRPRASSAPEAHGAAEAKLPPLEKLRQDFDAKNKALGELRTKLADAEATANQKAAERQQNKNAARDAGTARAEQRAFNEAAQAHQELIEAYDAALLERTTAERDRAAALAADPAADVSAFDALIAQKTQAIVDLANPIANAAHAKADAERALDAKQAALSIKGEQRAVKEKERERDQLLEERKTLAEQMLVLRTRRSATVKADPAADLRAIDAEIVAKSKQIAAQDGYIAGVETQLAQAEGALKDKQAKLRSAEKAEKSKDGLIAGAKALADRKLGSGRKAAQLRKRVKAAEEKVKAAEEKIKAVERAEAAERAEAKKAERDQEAKMRKALGDAQQKIDDFIASRGANGKADADRGIARHAEALQEADPDLDGDALDIAAKKSFAAEIDLANALVGKVSSFFNAEVSAGKDSADVHQDVDNIFAECSKPFQEPEFADMDPDVVNLEVLKQVAVRVDALAAQRVAAETTKLDAYIDGVVARVSRADGRAEALVRAEVVGEINEIKAALDKTRAKGAPRATDLEAKRAYVEHQQRLDGELAVLNKQVIETEFANLTNGVEQSTVDHECRQIELDLIARTRKKPDPLAVKNRYVEIKKAEAAAAKAKAEAEKAKEEEKGGGKKKNKADDLEKEVKRLKKKLKQGGNGVTINLGDVLRQAQGVAPEATPTATPKPQPSVPVEPARISTPAEILRQAQGVEPPIPLPTPVTQSAPAASASSQAAAQPVAPAPDAPVAAPEPTPLDQTAVDSLAAPENTGHVDIRGKALPELPTRPVPEAVKVVYENPNGGVLDMSLPEVSEHVATHTVDVSPLVVHDFTKINGPTGGVQEAVLEGGGMIKDNAAVILEGWSLTDVQNPANKQELAELVESKLNLDPSLELLHVDFLEANVQPSGDLGVKVTIIGRKVVDVPVHAQKMVDLFSARNPELLLDGESLVHQVNALYERLVTDATLMPKAEQIVALGRARVFLDDMARVLGEEPLQNNRVLLTAKIANALLRAHGFNKDAKATKAEAGEVLESAGEFLDGLVLQRPAPEDVENSGEETNGVVMVSDILNHLEPQITSPEWAKAYGLKPVPEARIEAEERYRQERAAAEVKPFAPQDISPRGLERPKVTPLEIPAGESLQSFIIKNPTQFFEVGVVKEADGTTTDYGPYLDSRYSDRATAAEYFAEIARSEPQYIEFVVVRALERYRTLASGGSFPVENFPDALNVASDYKACEGLSPEVISITENGTTSYRVLSWHAEGGDPQRNEFVEAAFQRDPHATFMEYFPGIHTKPGEGIPFEALSQTRARVAEARRAFAAEKAGEKAGEAAGRPVEPVRDGEGLGRLDKSPPMLQDTVVSAYRSLLERPSANDREQYFAELKDFFNARGIKIRIKPVDAGDYFFIEDVNPTSEIQWYLIPFPGGKHRADFFERYFKKPQNSTKTFSTEFEVVEPARIKREVEFNPDVHNYKRLEVLELGRMREKVVNLERVPQDLTNKIKDSGKFIEVPGAAEAFEQGIADAYQSLVEKAQGDPNQAEALARANTFLREMTDFTETLIGQRNHADDIQADLIAVLYRAHGIEPTPENLVKVTPELAAIRVQARELAQNLKSEGILSRAELDALLAQVRQEEPTGSPAEAVRDAAAARAASEPHGREVVERKTEMDALLAAVRNAGNEAALFEAKSVTKVNLWNDHAPRILAQRAAERMQSLKTAFPNHDVLLRDHDAAIILLAKNEGIEFDYIMPALGVPYVDVSAYYDVAPGGDRQSSVKSLVKPARLKLPDDLRTRLKEGVAQYADPDARIEDRYVERGVVTTNDRWGIGGEGDAPKPADDGTGGSKKKVDEGPAEPVRSAAELQAAFEARFNESARAGLAKAGVAPEVAEKYGTQFNSAEIGQLHKAGVPAEFANASPAPAVEKIIEAHKRQPKLSTGPAVSLSDVPTSFIIVPPRDRFDQPKLEQNQKVTVEGVEVMLDTSSLESLSLKNALNGDLALTGRAMVIAGLLKAGKTVRFTPADADLISKVESVLKPKVDTESRARGKTELVKNDNELFIRHTPPEPLSVAEKTTIQAKLTAQHTQVDKILTLVRGIRGCEDFKPGQSIERMLTLVDSPTETGNRMNVGIQISNDVWSKIRDKVDEAGLAQISAELNVLLGFDGLELILPKPGDKLNGKTMEASNTEKVPNKPRFTVARVLLPGFTRDGAILEKTRVVVYD